MSPATTTEDATMHNPTRQAPVRRTPGGSPRRWARWAPWATGPWCGLLGVVVLGATGCSLDSLLNSDQLPPDVSDPALSQTPQGARIAYAGTLSRFGQAFGGTGGGGTISLVAA